MKPVSILFLTILPRTQSPASSWFFGKTTVSCQHTRRHSAESRNPLLFLEFWGPTFGPHKSICLDEMLHCAYYDFRENEEIL